MASSSSSTDRPMRVLCLHGLTENASIMERKLTSMMGHLSPNDNLQFVFLSAPYVMPAVESAPLSKGGQLNLQSNKSSEQEQACEQTREFNKACMAISYLLAAHNYLKADKKRPQSDGSPGMDDLVQKYAAKLATIDSEARRKAGEHIFTNPSTSKRWWTLPSPASRKDPYIGQETSLAHISRAMREQGPFDGVIGFSTGSMMAAFCQALLQGSIPSSAAPSFHPPREQQPFQFAIHIAPWMVESRPYGAYLDALRRTDAKAHTPALCFEGVRDRHCLKGSCARFADCVGAERYEYHNGGHSIPSWDDYPAFMAKWLSLAAKECRGHLSREDGKRARAQLQSPYRDVKARQNHARL